MQALADCHFRSGRVDLALVAYSKLLQSCADANGDPVCAARQPEAQLGIARCQAAIDLRLATSELISPISAMVRQARRQRGVDETPHQARLRTLGRRLISRGRLVLGARCLQRWLDDVQRSGQSVDETSLGDIRDHALALWNAGEAIEAEVALRALVRVRQRQAVEGAGPSAIHEAMRDWGACLSAIGQRQSGSESCAMADAFEAGT
jgi:hypothetical protein